MTRQTRSATRGKDDATLMALMRRFDRLRPVTVVSANGRLARRLRAHEDHMADLSNVRIDGARLWDSLMEMAKIGGTPKGGSKRLTLTDLDREGRELFARWCRAAGL